MLFNSWLFTDVHDTNIGVVYTSTRSPLVLCTSVSIPNLFLSILCIFYPQYPIYFYLFHLFFTADYYRRLIWGSRDGAGGRDEA